MQVTGSVSPVARLCPPTHLTTGLSTCDPSAMDSPLILASGSAIRAQLLRNAGLSFDVIIPRIDESTIRVSLQQDGASPRDIADALADAKARRISTRHPEAWVIGSDQILALDDHIFAKPYSPADAMSQLGQLSGATHTLYSAAVIYCGGQPVWRHIGQVQLTMRPLSDQFLQDYVTRNWDSIQHCVGCYQIEAEGPRLFTRIDGDYFSILGLPLLELLSYLILRGTLPA
jgi:septum formation protein